MKCTCSLKADPAMYNVHVIIQFNAPMFTSENSFDSLRPPPLVMTSTKRILISYKFVSFGTPEHVRVHEGQAIAQLS